MAAATRGGRGGGSGSDGHRSDPTIPRGALRSGRVVCIVLSPEAAWGAWACANHRPGPPPAPAGQRASWGWGYPHHGRGPGTPAVPCLLQNPSMSIEGLRVVIAEDSVLLREGLTRLIEESGCEVVAKVGDGPAFVRRPWSTGPTSPSWTSGCRPPSATRASAPRSRRAGSSRGRRCSCSASTWSGSTRRSCSRTAAGGVGYLLKDRVADVREFVDALRRVAAGGTALDPEVVAQLVVRAPPDDRLTGSPRASGRCWPRWPRAARTRDRVGPVDHRGRGREARQQHLRQAGPARLGERPPPRAGGARLPGFRTADPPASPTAETR